MMSSPVLALILGTASPPEGGKLTNPDAASLGPRDEAALVKLFGSFVRGQPYGKSWVELKKSEPGPTGGPGLGAAKTHDGLKNDKAQVQEQVQFLEETAAETRYGAASIRGQRVFRYGKLKAVRVVFTQAGREPLPAFQTDLAALAEGWKDPLGLLGLGPAFRVTRNDLVERPAKKPGEGPLVIELEPAAKRPRREDG